MVTRRDFLAGSAVIIGMGALPSITRASSVLKTLSIP